MIEPGQRRSFISPSSGKTYWISVPKRWRHSDCDGFFSEARRTISIRPGLTEKRFREILWHELNHWAATPVANPETPDQSFEEVVVLTLERNLFPLLVRNPDLIDLLWPRKEKR